MKLLDLFCGAGGGAVGYARAGFTEIVGVDLKPQPRYPFAFVQGDALAYLAAHGHKFDAVHASPPCQRYSVGSRNWNGNPDAHPDLVAPTRAALVACVLPWVMENVPGSPLVNPVVLCGTSFGLKVFRHRLFEANFPLTGLPKCRHDGSTGSHRGYSTAASGANGYICVAGHNFEPKAGALAMGIDWMGSRKELAQAIPPAYTEFIGRQLSAEVAFRAFD